jgi:hypothetical protein
MSGSFDDGEKGGAERRRDREASRTALACSSAVVVPPKVVGDRRPIHLRRWVVATDYG